MLTQLIKKLFKKSQPLYQSGWDTNLTGNFISFDSITGSSSQSLVQDTEKEKRLARKPVEIFKEIICDEPKLDLRDLDSKIKLVEKRKKLFQEELGVMTHDEDQALIFLKARKKLIKNPHNFKWATTTDKLIASLCKKYLVSKVDFYTYARTLPMEAVKELEKYLKEYKKYSRVKPLLYLIIDDEPPEKSKKDIPNDRKKDPILLASSPFGKWYFILGAWDKEVRIVDALVYRGK